MKRYHLLTSSVFIFLFLSFIGSKAQTANFTFTPHSGCDQISVQFTDASTGSPTSWVWKENTVQFSTLQNPSHIFSSPGTYVISLTVNGGSTKYDTVYVYQSPTASFSTVDDTTCVGAIATFTSTSTPGSGTINTYIWSWGDGSEDTVTTVTTSHSYLITGNYTVNLVIIDSHNCQDASVNDTLHVYPLPVAHFNIFPTSACSAPVNVIFTNTSFPPATSYSWNFGDPASGASNTSGLTNPTHVFATNGTYPVLLTATTGACQDTEAVTFYVQPETASFTMTGDSVCFNDTVFFTNTSFPPPTLVAWNFGDPASGPNNTSTILNPFHVFSGTGSYTIQLIATSNNCTDTTSKSIYVRSLPNVSFTNSDSTNCSPVWLVNFFGSGTNIATWSWNFGDGSALDTTQNPPHYYTTAGIYNVTLNVIDIYGCKNSSIHVSDIQIVPPTVQIITLADSGCTPKTVFLQALTTVGLGDSITNITWHFGDGTAPYSGTDTVTHVFNFTGTGIYTVSVTLTTRDGCTVTDSIVGLIRVGTHASVDFAWSPDSVCYGDVFHFWSLSTPGLPYITGYLWSFGSTDSSAYMPTVGLDTGWVDVKLTVYCNGCGTDTTISHAVYINGPIPLFTDTFSCTTPYTVQFYNQSKDADSVVWNWGDASIDSSNSPNPVVHIFPSTSWDTIYSVILTAYNYASGCHYSDTLLVHITDIKSIPLSSPMQGCYPFSPNFTGSTSHAASTYSWDFGDPASGALNTSALANPVHLYNDTGFYNVKLTVTDIHNCVSTDSITVKAIGAHPSFMSSDTAGCRPFTARFDASASTDFGGNITSYFWNFIYPTFTAISTVATDTTSHTYNINGFYSVQLITTDNNGCHDTLLRNNYIAVMHPTPSYFQPDTFLCTNNLANFTGLINDIAGSGAYSYLWNFGDGSPLINDTNITSTSNSVTHTYTATPAVDVLTLIVSDRLGCTDSIKQNITILDPSAVFTYLATDSCGYTNVQFHGPTNDSISSWFWTISGPFGYNSNSINTNPSFNFTIPGSYTDTLTVTNPGCSNTYTGGVIAVQGPQAYFDYDTLTHCPPVSINFTSHLTNDSTYEFIQWDFGDGSPPQFTPYPNSSITYTYYSTGSFYPQALIAYRLPNNTICLYRDVNILRDTILITSNLNVNISTTPLCYNLIKEGDIDTLYSSYSDVGNNSPYTYTWTSYPGQHVLPSYNTTGAVFTATDTSTSSIHCNDTVPVNSYVVVTLTDNHGCRDYDTIYYRIRPCEQDIVIPNVFTPNGDNLNDTYYIGKKDTDCPIIDFTIKIFNRWGNVVYHDAKASAFDFAWDGKDDNGKDCNDGTYYYVMSYVIRGNKPTLHGYIELIRDKKN